MLVCQKSCHPAQRSCVRIQFVPTREGVTFCRMDCHGPLWSINSRFSFVLEQNGRQRNWPLSRAFWRHLDVWFYRRHKMFTITKFTITMFTITMFTITMFTSTLFTSTMFTITMFTITTFAITMLTITMFTVTMFTITMLTITLLVSPSIVSIVFDQNRTLTSFDCRLMDLKEPELPSVFVMTVFFSREWMHWWVNALMSECIDEWVHWWVDALRSECIDEWVHWWMSALMSGCIYEWMHWWVCALMSGCIDEWRHWWVDALMDAWINEWKWIVFYTRIISCNNFT